MLDPLFYFVSCSAIAILFATAIAVAGVICYWIIRKLLRVARRITPD